MVLFKFSKLIDMTANLYTHLHNRKCVYKLAVISILNIQREPPEDDQLRSKHVMDS